MLPEVPSNFSAARAGLKPPQILQAISVSPLGAGNGSWIGALNVSVASSKLDATLQTSFAAALLAQNWIVQLPIPPWMLAVLVSVGASAFTVAGFVVQKKAVCDPSNTIWPKVGSIVLSPAWIAGFLLTAILPVLGDLAAYSLAPLTLTTPLSGVSVVLNMVIAPWALSEQLQWFPDFHATVLILIGCAATTAFGDHDGDASYSADQLLELSTRCAFLVSLVLGGMVALYVTNTMNTKRAVIEKLARENKQNPYLPHVVLPASAASLCGAFANIGLKCIGELAKGKKGALGVLICGAVVGPPAILQVNFINRGLFLYPQSIFMSVYGALLVLANTVYGALFFEEYVALLRSSTSFVLFCSGCSMIVSGIWLFRFRKPGKKLSDLVEPPDDVEKLLAMDNLGGEVSNMEANDNEPERTRTCVRRGDDDDI